MATNGIQVPVSLYVENLQKIINDLKGQLGNLKVGSSGFKAMENHIRTLQKELDKFQIQASKPFIAEGQFTAAEKSVTKLEDEIEKVSLTASRLKFSDLELNGEQKAQLKAVEDQINAIKASLKAAKDEAKKNFLSSDLGKQWVDLNPSEATRTLDQITNNIRKAVDDQNKQVQRAKEVVDEYKRTITMGDIAQNVAKSTRGLKSDKSSAGLEALMGKEFSDFFTKRANGDVAGFKAGQRGFFAEWLTKNFTIDPTIVKDLVSKTAPEIARVLNDAQSTIRQELNKAIANADTAKVNLPAANVAVSDAEAKVQALIPYLQQAMQATDGLKISEDSLREALAAAGITLENTKESIAANVRGSQEWSNVNQRATAELENLKNTLSQTNAQFLQQQRVTQNFNAMKMAVVNFMGFRQVLNLTKTAIREAINHIKELDSVMNKISIVTDMSTSDLWQQVDQYSKMAQAYGTSIKGAYEVSQIYYQQGLETNDVLTLTNETLKLAKVSGLDYATTTDYMTTALRGFKMEMSEASKVVDVYSNLAAHTAVSSEELAVAMSKTASSMESVGSTFEETSAMIGTMVAVTRESATNIGSALKSIASRYGEMKSDPLKLVDSEGDEMSFNKVDAALQSVGITMKTVDGQFRNFTDVIIELSEKWDQLESTQQRYIATQFAGNRQQSRFLALVSNPELLKANLSYAEESEDTGTLQALKALDSIESKLNQVQVAYQQFYTTLGVENVWKGLLDGTTNVINTLNRLPKLFGKLPISAINAIGSIIVVVKNLGLSLLGIVAKGIQAALPQAKTGTETWTNTIINTVKGKTGEAEAAGKALGNALNKGLEETRGLTAWGANNITKGQANNWSLTAKFASSAYATKEESQKAWTSLADQMKGAGVLTDEGFNIIKAGGQGALDIIERIRIAILGEGNAAEESKGKLANWSTAHKKGLSSLQSFGSALNLVATAIDTSTTGGKQLSGTFMALSGVIVTTTALIKAAGEETKAIPWVAIASGIISAVSGIMTIIQSFSLEAKLEEATKKAEELTNKAKELKANYRTLDTNIKKYKELEKARYDSAEAAEEYQNAVDELAEKFPQLISSFDESGNAILSAVSMENNLTQAREDAAKAALAAAKAEKEKATIDLQKKQQDLSGAAFELKAKAERYAIGGADYARNHETGKTLKQNERNLLTLKNLLEEDTTDTGKEILSWINNNVKIPTNEHIIQTLFYKISESIGQGDYNQAAKLKNWASDIYSLLNWDIGPIFSEVFNNVSTLLSEVTPMANLITSSNKEIVNSWLRSSKYNTLPVIKNNGAFSIIQQAILSSAKEDFSDIHLERLSQDILEPFNTLWNMLSDNVQSQVNEILSHPENYTATDLQKIFSDAKVEQLVPQWIYDTFNEQNDSIRRALTQKANLIITEQQKEVEVYGEFYAMLESETTQFTLNEQKFLVQALDQIASITESGFSADGMMGAINDLFSQIQSLSYGARNALLEQILTNGFSAEGWNKTLEYIKNNTQFNFNSINTNLINTIIKESIPNYALAASSAIGEIEDSWENLDKFFSSLSKGVNQTEVDSLINQAQSLDLSLVDTDFHADGENMIISATKLISLIDDYQNKLSIPINNLKTDLEKAFNTLSDSFTSLFDGIDQDGLISQEVIDSNLLDYYKRILYTDFGDYFQLNTNGEWTAILQEGESLEEAESRIWNAVWQHYQDNLNALNKVNNYYEILFTNLKKSLKWKSGDYSSLNNILKNGDKFEDILKDPKKLYSEEYINEPDIKSAFNQATQAYSNLISDVLSKGLKNINLKDYEGLDNEIEIITDNISYRDFVNNYAQYTNKTAAEINDLLIQAIQKDQAKISSDVLKDLTFINKDIFTISLEGLKELANVYEVKAEDFNNWINEYYNAATGKATVRVSDLLEKYQIDLTKVNDFTQMVQESVDSLFSDLISNIQAALSGKLDSKGMKSLRESLPNLGITNKLDFTHTAEDIKMTEESFFGLYNSIKKVNSLAAKKLIPSIKEMSKQYGNLIDTQKAYDQAVKARNLEKAEALADVISDYLRTSADSYSFNKSTMPLEWQKAQNLYTAAYQSGKTIQASSKSKFMGAEDFYSQMQLLASYNPDAQIAGQTAAYWLDHAPEFYTMNNKGEFGIDLKKAGFNSKDFTEWINAMISAGDEIRKAGLVYEETTDKLNKSAKAVNWDEIINDYGKVDKEKLKQAIENNTALSEGLSRITFNNGTLLDNLDELPEDLLSTIVQRLSKGEFTPEELSEQISEMLGANGDKINVVIDSDGKINIEYAVEDGKIVSYLTVGGQKLSGDKLTEYLQLTSQENASIIEGTEGFSVNFTLDDMQVQAEYNAESAGYVYRIDSLGITANSLEELKTALAVHATEEAETSTNNNVKTYKFTVHGIQYEIGIDSSGKILGGERIIGGSVENLTEEAIQKIQEELDKQKEQKLTTEVTADGKVSSLSLELDENATVELVISEVQLTEIIERAFGSTSKLNVNPKEVVADVNGKEPQLEGILDPVSYSKEVGILLEELLLSNDSNTEIEHTITIGDDKIKYTDIVNALLTGKLKINGSGVTVDDSSEVTLADGQKVKLPAGTNVGAEIAKVLLKGTNVTTADGGISYAEGADSIPFGDLTGRVSKLILEWLNPEESHEPDTDLLGLKTEYSAPDATMTQHIDVKYEWSFTGEGDALNQQATKIREMLNNNGFEGLGSGTTFMYQLDKSDAAKQIIEAINNYTEQGGTRYKVENGWVIEAVVDLDTEESDEFIEDEHTAEMTVEANIDEAKKAIENLDAMASAPITKKVYVESIDSDAEAKGTTDFRSNNVKAQTHVALAGGSRQTLMGELGPEMYVQNGHYYIAGQSGPEMVSLADDAIVFNHLQTERLLKNGKTYGHGKPITNEHKAIGEAHAKGITFAEYKAAVAQLEKAKSGIKSTTGKSYTDTQNLASYKRMQSMAEDTIMKWKKQVLAHTKSQKEAADTQKEAAEELISSAKEQQKAVVIPDSNKLHTGYKRAPGYQGTSATATNGRYVRSEASRSRLPLGNSIRTVVNINSNGKKGKSADTTKELEEKQKQVASVISNLLSEGFEAIDLSSSAYEKLDTKYKAEMQQFINQTDASYRDFVEKYGEEANLTTKQFNEQYFQAWQKDVDNLGLSSEVRDAAKGLSFYSGGAIGGSAEDWTTIFGEYTNASELASAGIISWNEDLQQYIVTSIEALQEFDTNLNINEFQDIIADSMRQTSKAMVDLLSEAEAGDITHEDFNKLNAYLKQSGLNEISKEFLETTADGLILSYKVLAEKYQEAIQKNLSPETVEQLYELKIKALEDNNARIRKNLERNNKFTSGAEKEAVDALTFFANDSFIASLDQLEALANSAEIDLNDILKNATWDQQLQQFVVSNKSAIEGIDWSNIENFGDLVADDIQSILDIVVDLLSKAKSGEISNQEFAQLNSYLNKAGLDEISKDYLQKTSNGLMLNYKILVNKYNEAVAKSLDPELIENLYNLKIQSIEENNARVKTQIERANKSNQNTGAFKDAVDALTFFGQDSFIATLDQLESLANQAEIDLNDVLANAEWDSRLQQYVINNKNAIDGIDWSKIENLGDLITDDINGFFETIVENVRKGLSGGISNADITSMKGYLNAVGLGDVNLDFTQTVDGLKMSQESATHLYYELKKVDKIKAELVFKELRASLEENNDKYKTMASLLDNIADLQKKIDEGEKYNDAKIKQYKEELQLAKEIAEIRATSKDESFNFLNADIPGALNNPLNYVDSWANAWRELRAGAQENKAVDFKHYYNIITQMHDLAKLTGEAVDFMGMTIDGSIETWDAAINMGIDALGTDADNAYGVLFSRLGDGLTGGVDSYADSADMAIHNMANAQIKIIDALIKMFEVIVALEEFEKADIDLNGILDLNEIFADATEMGDEAVQFTEAFKSVANTLVSQLDENSEMNEAFNSVKLNGYTLNELIRDAADGMKETNLNAKDYASAVSILYEMAKNGDFDLDNIAQSLREQLLANKSNFKGTIEYGNFVIDLMYDVAIEKRDGKYYTPKGTAYDTATAAARAAALEDLGVEAGAITIDAEQNAQGTLTIADTEIIIDALPSGLYYTYGSNRYGTKEECLKAIFTEQTGGGDSEAFERWKIDKGITVVAKIDEVDVSALSPDQINNAIGKTYEEVRAEWNTAMESGNEDDLLTFKAKYGIDFDEHTTEEDWNNFKEMAGIESKTVEITASVKLTNTDENTAKLIQIVTTTDSSATYPIDADISAAEEKIKKLHEEAETKSIMPIDADTAQALLQASNARQTIDGYDAEIDVDADVSDALDKLDKVIDKISEINNASVTVNVSDSTSSGVTSAKGNVALAAGRTLMGELGPELYVTNGRYFIAGQNGAEFVNLPKDAIVFNHLQTQRLLSAGSTGRGSAVTTEANAVAFAKGIGPAAASAKQTLATLKQLRAMWQRLAESSIVDLAGLANKEKGNRTGSWLADVERWYNWLQKIARLEKEINYQEALRSKLQSDRVPDGTAYYQTQVESLKNLQEQAATQKNLADSYDEYFQKRREELNNAPVSKFYEFDEAGQLRYKEGGLAALADITALTDEGKPKYTPQQQYDIMKAYGLGDYMLYDSSGLRIEADSENMDQFYRDSVQAGWERMVSEQQEMQDLYNNREDAKKAYLEDISKANALLQEIVDNQLNIEQKTLDALEQREQKIIDRMTKERQALADSSAKYFDGLEKALSKEREIFSKQQDKDNLTKLQRQLSILQRSGGSASEIANLEKQISDAQRESYFDAQEQAIQNAKDAADLELEKMQEQIDLMTETLEYQKANGLLWNEVSEILKGTSESIIAFITTNMPEWQEKSSLAQEEELRTLRSSAEQWTAYRDNTMGSTLNTHTAMDGFQELVDVYASALMEAWQREVKETTPGALTESLKSLRDSVVAQTRVATAVLETNNTNTSTQIDKLEVNMNFDKLPTITDMNKLKYVSSEPEWLNKVMNKYTPNRIGG